MDPKKPGGKKEEPGSDDSPDRSAGERADALTSPHEPEDGPASTGADRKPAAPEPTASKETGSRKPGDKEPGNRETGSKQPDRRRSVLTGSGSGPEGRQRGRLTEKQRVEARRKRREKRRLPVSGNVLSRGVRATGNEIRRTSLFVGRAILSGLDSLKPVGGIIAGWLGVAARTTGSIFAGLAHGISALFAALGRVILALDRIITPRRALITIALFAGGLLAASQFIDYRAIEIGQPGYIGVADVTQAPQVEIKTPYDTHSVLLLAFSVLALGGAVGSALTRRRRYAGAIALAGGVAVLVALAIDLPRGLDAAEAELSYAGVEAVLLSGFWLELGAGTVLAVTGLSLLAAPSGTPRPARSRRPDRGADARHQAVAGGRA